MATKKKMYPVDEELTLTSAVTLLRAWATLSALTARDDLSLRLAAAVSIVTEAVEENESQNGGREG